MHGHILDDLSNSCAKNLLKRWIIRKGRNTVLISWRRVLTNRATWSWKQDYFPNYCFLNLFSQIWIFMNVKWSHLKYRSHTMKWISRAKDGNLLADTHLPMQKSEQGYLRKIQLLSDYLKYRRALRRSLSPRHQNWRELECNFGMNGCFKKIFFFIWAVQPFWLIISEANAKLSGKSHLSPFMSAL